MCLPNIKGGEIVGSVTQLLCGTERPQILHLKKSEISLSSRRGNK